MEYSMAYVQVISIYAQHKMSHMSYRDHNQLNCRLTISENRIPANNSEHSEPHTHLGINELPFHLCFLFVS